MTKRLQDRLVQALAELHRKSLKDIQEDTALTWCARACAAAHYAQGLSADGHASMSHDALEYAHEAIEHAALNGSDALLREVRTALRSCGVDI